VDIGDPLLALVLGMTGGDDATCRVWVVDHHDMAVALTNPYVQTALKNSGEGEHNKILCCCHVLWGHESSVSCLAFSSDLDVVLSGAIDGVICVHSVRSGDFVRSVRVDDSFELNRTKSNDSYSDDSQSCGNDNSFHECTGVRLLALDTTGTFVAHMEDGMLYIYTVNGVYLCSTDSGDLLHTMEICPNSEMLVTGGDRGHVVMRNLSDLGVRCVLDLTTHGPIRCISFTPAESIPTPQYMIVGTDDGMMTVVDACSDNESMPNAHRSETCILRNFQALH